MTTTLATVSPTERDRAVATLTLAFAADPIMRWLYPNASDYLAHFPELMVAFGGSAFEQDTVWQLEGGAAVAMWMAPGIEPDGEATVKVFEASVDPGIMPDLMGLFEQMEASHPTYPLWYLPWFGVDAALQGRGRGSELMRPCLDVVDGHHLPAYLDSTNPRNVTFYERHGFEVVGTWQTGASPPLISMLRAAR